MNVRFEKQLVKKAVKHGLPTEPLLHAFRFRRIVRAPRDWMQRLNAARRISATSRYADFVDKQKGYRRFGPDELPGIMDAVEAANLVYQNKLGNADSSDGKKPYFYNLLDRDDLHKHPQLLAFAESAPMLEAATGYLGTLPALSAIGVYYSPANETLEKSQLYHLDDEDLFQVKCFINVHDVKPENGPFTFIPADASRQVRRKLGHHWRGRRLTDEELQASGVLKHEVSLAGGAGTGCIVDTSSCLHYGSRCRAGHRLVIMFQYTRMPDVALLTEEELALEGDGRPLRPGVEPLSS